MTPLPGRLWLVPNTLDLGADEHARTPLDEVLPKQVIETAAALQYWVVENARTTRAFLRRIHHLRPLASPIQAVQIVELPRPAKGGGSRAVAPGILRELLAPALQGNDLGLQSEAGLPGLADPGAPLVQAAHEVGVRVCPMVGPSALLLAAGATGMNGQSFAFVGYLPVETAARAKRLRELEQRALRERQTQLFIETPYRNAALLDALLETLAPSTGLSVAAALTMPAQSVHAGRIQEWRRRLPSLPLDQPCVFAIGAW